MCNRYDSKRHEMEFIMILFYINKTFRAQHIDFMSICHHQKYIPFFIIIYIKHEVTHNIKHI